MEIITITQHELFEQTLEDLIEDGEKDVDFFYEEGDYVIIVNDF